MSKIVLYNFHVYFVEQSGLKARELINNSDTMAVHRMVTLSSVALRCSGSQTLLKSCNLQQIHRSSFRFLTVDHVNKQPNKQFKKEKEKVRMYLVQRYIDYVKNYTTVLEKRFPAAMKMYRVFSVGIKDFLKDLKTYILLRIKIAKDQGFQNVSRAEIELYQKMPRDMVKIAPVLILSAVPFGNYVIFPLAFLKPKNLLCSHFWSIQQKAEFTIQDLTDRLKHNKPVFRALQSKVDSIPGGDLKEQWIRILAKLGSGVHPSADEILEVQPLFSCGAHELNLLSYSHAGYLLRMHGLRKGVLRKSKLKYRAFLLLEMDKAIIREGGVESLQMECLRNACLMRGLNSTHLSNNDMRKWLEKWLSVSKFVDKQSYSLILHCPIFFAYNHPQNWMLIYTKP